MLLICITWSHLFCPHITSLCVFYYVKRFVCCNDWLLTMAIDVSSVFSPMMFRVLMYIQLILQLAMVTFDNTGGYPHWLDLMIPYYPMISLLRSGNSLHGYWKWPSRNFVRSFPFEMVDLSSSLCKGVPEGSIADKLAKTPKTSWCNWPPASEILEHRHQSCPMLSKNTSPSRKTCHIHEAFLLKVPVATGHFSLRISIPTTRIPKLAPLYQRLLRELCKRFRVREEFLGTWPGMTGRMTWNDLGLG